MASADPLGGPSPLPGMPDPLHSWHGIDAGLVDKWSIGSRPSLFLLPGGRLHLVELAMLPLLRRVRLGERCGANRSAKRLRLRRLKRMESIQSTDWGLSSAPKAPMAAHQPKPLLRA